MDWDTGGAQGVDRSIETEAVTILCNISLYDMEYNELIYGDKTLQMLFFS